MHKETLPAIADSAFSTLFIFSVYAAMATLPNCASLSLHSYAITCHIYHQFLPIHLHFSS